MENVHEWPGYVPHDVTAVRPDGQVWHWTEYWAVDALQIREFLELHDCPVIWLRIVEIPESSITPLDLECDGCDAAPDEPCRVGCLGRDA